MAWEDFSSTTAVDRTAHAAGMPAGDLHFGERQPLFLLGDALPILASFPASCIDGCVTSPPCWGRRADSGGGIGLEEVYGQDVEGGDIHDVRHEVVTVAVSRGGAATTPAVLPAVSFWDRRHGQP